MKKLLFICVITLLSSTLFAQTGNLISGTNNTAIDTVANTAVKSQSLLVNGANTVITVVSTITKISGTVAGSLQLLGSIDGVNYAKIDTAITPTDVSSQTFSWSLTPSKFIYYKVSYTGAGTMSAKLSSKALWRK